MSIAIIAAMEEEVAILKSHIINCQTTTILGTEFFTGQIAGCDIVLLKSGIGKVAAAAGTTLLLNHFQVEKVINTGSAGGLSSHLNIGDIVISTCATYHDADLTAFGYEYGQMAGCPVDFAADHALQQLAKNCVEKQGLSAISGLIASGDMFINSKEKRQQISKLLPDTIAVEMEAAAIAHVCWMFGVPFVVVRAISDNGDEASAISFDEFLPLAAKHSSQIVEAMLAELK